MGQVPPREFDFGVDLESGLGVNVEDSGKEPTLVTKIPVQTLLLKVCDALVDGKPKGDEELNLCGDVPNLNGISVQQAKLEGENTEKKVVKDKRKKTSHKKPPKPPRPPGAPSLDSADQKLLKEISEIAMLKRARIERMKALKKMKAGKASSSSSNLFATVFTILFCLVMMLQAMSSKGTSVIQASTVSPGMAEDNVISVQFVGKAPSSNPNGGDPGSFNSVGPVTGSDSSVKLRNAARTNRRK